MRIATCTTHPPHLLAHSPAPTRTLTPFAHFSPHAPPKKTLRTPANDKEDLDSWLAALKAVSARTDEYRRFMETYRRFVLEFVQPQIYDGGVPPQRPKGFNHGRAAQSTMAPAALLSPSAQRPLCSSHTRPRAGVQRRSSTSASPSCAS